MPIDLEKISNSNSFSCSIQIELWPSDYNPLIKIDVYRNLGMEVEQEILKLSTLSKVRVENWKENNQFRIFCPTGMRDTIAEELYRCLTEDHGLTVERREKNSARWTASQPRSLPFTESNSNERESEIA